VSTIGKGRKAISTPKDLNQVQTPQTKTSEAVSSVDTQQQAPAKVAQDALSQQALGGGLNKQAPGAFTKTGNPGLLFHQAQKLSGEPFGIKPANLPEWVPASFNLLKAAKVAKNLLIAQGADPSTIGPGKANSLIFTDADHTLIKTTTPVLLKNSKTGEFLHHPKTGRIVTLRGTTYREELEAMQKEFPKLDWDNIGFDYSGMADPAEVHQAHPIQATVDALAEHQSEKGTRDFIITARSAANIPAVFVEYMNDLGHDIDGTFPVNEPGLRDAFEFSKHPNLDTHHNKALTMAALIELYQPGGAKMERVRFYEDSDANLKAAMELLPKMFPNVDFEFFDVVHTGHEQFEHRLVAFSDKEGTLKNARTGQPMTDRDIDKYESNDAQLPPAPHYVPPDDLP